MELNLLFVFCVDYECYTSDYRAVLSCKDTFFFNIFLSVWKKFVLLHPLSTEKTNEVGVLLIRFGRKHNDLLAQLV